MLSVGVARAEATYGETTSTTLKIPNDGSPVQIGIGGVYRPGQWTAIRLEGHASNQFSVRTLDDDGANVVYEQPKSSGSPWLYAVPGTTGVPLVVSDGAGRASSSQKVPDTFFSLIAKVRCSGNEELFEVLARKHSRMLIAYLRAAGCDQALADDVWQETMIVAWKKLDEFDRSLAFGPWLRRIAAKVLMSSRRKSGRMHLVRDETELNYLSERMDRVHSLAGDTLDEKLDALRDCISLLPESDRECIELRFRDDLMPAAICERIGLTLDTVKKRLLRESYAQPQRDDDRVIDLMSKLKPTRIVLAKRVDRYVQFRRHTISVAIAATIILAVGVSLFLRVKAAPRMLP